MGGEPAPSDGPSAQTALGTNNNCLRNTSGVLGSQHGNDVEMFMAVTGSDWASVRRWVSILHGGSAARRARGAMMTVSETHRRNASRPYA